MGSRCDGLAEGVGNADCDGDGLGAVGVGCVEGVASEDEGDDSGVEVLVDAGEALDFDVDAVSSRTSRQTPSSNCSPSSRTPPGGSQWPLSRRWMTRIWPASLTTIPATLTECRGVSAIPVPSSLG